MSCIIFTKMRKFTKFRVRSFVFANSDIYIFATLPGSSCFRESFCEKQQIFSSCLEHLLSSYTQIFRENLGKNLNFLRNFVNLISSKYFHKNCHFVLHVADKFCLFVINLK
jgi:hypothetical protein